MRHSSPAQPERLAALGARRDDQGCGAGERRHLDAPAKDRLRQGNRHLGVQVVALADENRVTAHPGAHEEIARWSAEWPGVALIGHTNLSAGVHPRRNRH